MMCTDKREGMTDIVLVRTGLGMMIWGRVVVTRLATLTRTNIFDPCQINIFANYLPKTRGDHGSIAPLIPLMLDTPRSTILGVEPAVFYLQVVRKLSTYLEY